MPRVKSKSSKTAPPASSTSSSSSVFSAPQLPRSTKRRLNYDELVEEESVQVESKSDMFESEKPKRMKTRSISRQLDLADQPSTSSEPLPAGDAASSRLDIEYANAELPRSAWIVSDLDWTVVSTVRLFTEIKQFESSLYFESQHFHEFLEIPGLEVMGNINLRLKCGQVIHIEDAVYVDSAKFNVISIQSLKEQKLNPLDEDSNYSLCIDKNHLYLVDKNGGKRIQLTRRVANKMVLLTEEPSIEQVIAHAEENRIPEMRSAWIKNLLLEPATD